MIYVLAVFAGMLLFFMGLVLGYILPFSAKRTLKKAAPKRKARSQNEPQKEIRNFLNYDGSPLP